MTDLGRGMGGIAFLCGEQGSVLDVLYDGLGIAGEAILGRPFVLLVDRDSVAKALNFLVEVKTQGAMSDCELNIPFRDDLATLHFAGVAADGRVLLVGAPTGNGILQLCESLLQVDNEQVNPVRAALKGHVDAIRAQAGRDNRVYDELSQLNNELVTLQRELVKKNVELEKLNQLKNQFLGMAAHDLRTPLDLIWSYSEFLLDETAGYGPEQRRFLSIIHSSSEFMLHLIDDLLDISAIESGKLELDLAPGDLGPLAERNVALNGLLAEKKGIRLSLQRDEEVPRMLFDASKIEQVLNNFISNAVKYSYPGSLVEVSIRRGEGGVVLAVQDHGQGIPSEEMDQLFQVFGKTSVQGTAGEKSTGLGLAIARRIVLEHGGKIWVESQEGRGSTFYVWLPVAPPTGGEQGIL
jgi:signal transduction histidine kinase